MINLDSHTKFMEIDGQSIRYFDEGEGEPILFVHGLGGSMSNWLPSLEFLPAQFRVVSLDLPGFGKSRPALQGISLGHYESVIRKFLSSRGVEKACVVGNSMGGMITLHLALYAPELVESMVLVDAVGGYQFPAPLRWAMNEIPFDWLHDAMVIQYRLLRHRFAYRLAGFYLFNEYTENLLAEAGEVLDDPDLEDYLKLYVDGLRMCVEVSYQHRLSEIDIPTLIIWGQHDAGIPLRIGQKLNRGIKGSYLVALPDAAHVPQLDQPSLFNDTLTRFLRGVGSKSLS